MSDDLIIVNDSILDLEFSEDVCKALTPAAEGEFVDRDEVARKFSVIEQHKTILAGLISLNQTLFDQAIVEAGRIPKIRGVVQVVENELLNEDKIKNLNPDQLVKVYDTSRKSLEGSLQFMERMYRLTSQTLEMLQLKREIESGIHDHSAKQEEVSNIGNVDKSKVALVKSKIIELASKKR